MEYWRQRLPGALWSLATLEDALDDLAGALRERRIWRVGRIVSALAQHWNVLLGFAGLLAGVAVYTVSLGYDRYYGALGLDPEDVGVGPAAVLGRSALGTALFTAVGAAVLIAFVAPLGAAIAPMLERQARQLPGGCAKAVALPRLGLEHAARFALLTLASFAVLTWAWSPAAGAAGVCAAGTALTIALRSGWPRIAAATVSGLFTLAVTTPTWLGAAVIAAFFALIAGVSDGVRLMRRRRSRLPRVAVDAVRVDAVTNVSIALVLTLMCVIAVIGTLPSIGSDAGAQARMGRLVEATKFAGVSVLDVSARPAKVLWKSPGGHRPDVRGCLLYLGHDAGTALVYHVKRVRPITAANHRDPPPIASRTLLRIEPEDAFVTIGRNDQCLPSSAADPH